MRIQNITDMIGNTPLVRVNDKVKYYAKIEGSNLFGSVKDRAARYLMENAYNDGIIKNDTVIIESSSGNFGIALAGMCKIKGNPFICVVDPNITEVNRKIIELLGAEIIIASKTDENGNYVQDRIQIVRDYIAEHENVYWTNQYENQYVWKAYFSLGEELCNELEQMNVAFKNLIYMLYSRDLSNKVSSAMHTRILKGENISGQLRYGYVKDPNDKHKIIVDPEAAEVVKLIFELTAQGKSKTEVANYLNAQGIDTPSVYKKRKGSRNFFHAVEVKSLWSTSSIRDILNDEVYLGKLIWNKTKKRIGSNNTSSYVPKDEWMVIENCHEPIITQELFDMAHANSKKCVRLKRGKRNYNPFYYCGVWQSFSTQQKGKR